MKLAPFLLLAFPVISGDAAIATFAPDPEVVDNQRILALLEQSISRHENCAAFENPGCLVFAGQPNAWRLSNGYARFRSLRDGWQALDRDLQLKLGRGMTVEEIMDAWNTGTYLADVLRETGLRPDTRWALN